MRLKKAEVLALLLGVVLLLIAVAPSASAAEKDDSLLKIVDSGPMKSIRGFPTGNPDNTYYPGDFFSITVEANPDGHHGRAVVGETEYKWQIEKPEVDDWYDSMDHIVNTGETLSFESKEDAKDAAANRVDDEPNWNNPRAKKVEDDATPWVGFYDKHHWEIKMLDLIPAIKVDVWGPKVGGPADVVPVKEEFPGGRDVSEGQKTELGFKVQEGAPPGTYTSRVVFPVPHRGHNNPHENVAEPVVVKENFRVVKYEPKLWQIPYLELNWKRQTTEWMLQKPNAVVTRYDGSEDENGKLHEDRRAIVSAMSFSGQISKPLHANHMFQRRNDDGSPDYENENVKPFSIDAGGTVKLAEKPNGNYYESGTLVSTAISFGGSSTAWSIAEMEADEPDETGIKGYVRFGNQLDNLMERETGWIPFSKLSTEDGKIVQARYAQYRAVLWTKNPGKTPALKKIFLKSSDGKLIQASWRSGPGKRKVKPETSLVYRDLKSFWTAREPVMYHEGDLLYHAGGGLKTGTVKLVPKRFKSYWSSGSRIRFELKPDKESLENRGLEDKTDSLDDAPSSSDLFVRDMCFWRSKERGGEKIFVSAWKGLKTPGVQKNYSVEYHENRYKKWRFSFFPTRFAPPFVPPKFRNWFEDATVKVKPTFWFHQRVSGWNGGEEESFKKLFSSDLIWSPRSTYQPVQTAAWELKDDLEDEVLDNPSMVFQDNVWKIDKDVKFDLKFTGMNDPENFLEMSHQAAKQLAPRISAGNGKIQKIDPANENVIKSFKFPEPRPLGLARGENYLWSVGEGSENSGDETIYKLDSSDGSVVRKLAPPSPNPASIAWDDQYLWVAHKKTGAIRKIDPLNKTVVDTISSPGFSPSGLAWGDNGLWYVDEYLENVYRLDPSDGDVVQTFSPRNFSPSALTWGNQLLWIVGEGSLVGGSGKIHKVNPRTENVVGSFTLPSSSPSALAWDGRQLWVTIPGSKVGFEGAARRIVKSEKFQKRMAEKGVSIGEEDVEGMRESLLALANMDNKMMNMILGDWKAENAGAQLISGIGRVVENIDYRFGGYYAIAENVKPPGKDVVERTEMAKLPFDPDEVAEFDINVTGEGLVAGVESDGPHQAEIKIYAPDRAGGIRSAVLYDNEGNILVERDFRKSAFGWLPQYVSAIKTGNIGAALEGRKESETKTLSFTKWENSPTHLEIKMTNEWGATVRQELRVSPGRAYVPWGASTDLKWLILAVLAMVAWTSFCRWWGEKKGRKNRALPGVST